MRFCIFNFLLKFVIIDVFVEFIVGKKLCEVFINNKINIYLDKFYMKILFLKVIFFSVRKYYNV